MKNRKEYKGNYGVRLDILAFSPNSKKASLTPLVPVRAKEILKQKGPSFASSDIARIIIDEYLEIIKILRPNGVDLIGSVVGNLPLVFSPINPVSLLGAVKMWQTRAETEGRLSWILAIEELKNLSK